jgi:hypothetical protein
MRWSNEQLLAYNRDVFITDYIFLVIVFILVAVTVYLMGRKAGCHHDRWKFVLLFVYRTIFSYCYYIWAYNDVWVDTKRYFSNTAEGEGLFMMYGQAMDFIQFFLYPFVHWFKLTFLSCFVLFNLLGFWGVCLLFCAVRDITNNNPMVNRYMSVAIFFPGMNYWTSMIGKDAMIFMGIGMLLYCLYDLKNRKMAFVVSLVIIAHVRPYMGIITLPCLAAGFLTVSGNIKSNQKLTILLIMAVASIPLYYAFLNHVRLDALTLDSAAQVIKKHQSHWGGGSYVDLTNANIFVQVFTYLFRPLFFDARNIVQFFASLENLAYLCLAALLCTPKFILFVIRGKTLLLRFSFIYFIVGSLVLASSTPNLGTAARQKNMVMIALLVMVSMYFHHLTPFRKRTIKASI